MYEDILNVLSVWKYKSNHNEISFYIYLTDKI